MFNSPEDILQKIWGYPFFRKGQAEVVDAVLEGRDVLGLMPTGAGKSICYQVSGIAFGGVTIVISPLISLMKDQQSSLLNKGLKAYAIYAGMSSEEIDSALKNCINQEGVKFLFVSPERLHTKSFKNYVVQMDVRLLVVDEAHCISQWGHDFRPAYLLINELREVISPDAPVLALTASATQRVQDEIVSHLNFRENYFKYQGDFSRPNLRFYVKNTENKDAKLVSLLNRIKGSKIVYCNTRKSTISVTKLLKENGVQAVHYHAGLDPQDRNKRQEYWLANKFDVIVATNAFGMGIDKPDVRLVVHYQVPSSLEAYYQEAGRAGRDGEEAFAVLLSNEKEVQDMFELFESNYPSFKDINKVYNALGNYYKIALGVKPPVSEDFDFGKVSSEAKVDVSIMYHALKRLEDMGVVQTNEDFYAPSRVKLLLSNQELYTFQVSNKDFEPLLKVILRNYGTDIGIAYSKIDEEAIGEAISLPKSQVEMKLKQLNSLGVIDYHHSQHEPQLTFTEGRLEKKELQSLYHVIEVLKQHKKSSLNHMIDYLNSNKCRSLFITEYFGASGVPCNVCDNCQDYSDDHIKSLIIDELSKGPKRLDDLFDELFEYKDSQLKKVIKSQVENDFWIYKNGQLSVS